MRNQPTINLGQVDQFLYSLEADTRLKVWHVALLITFIMFAVRQKRVQRVRVSRSKIMSFAHITTLPTYHKYLKELQEMGYIHYRPSYHPSVRSEIDLLTYGS